MTKSTDSYYGGGLGVEIIVSIIVWCGWDNDDGSVDAVLLLFFVDGGVSLLLFLLMAVVVWWWWRFPQIKLYFVQPRWFSW